MVAGPLLETKLFVPQPRGDAVARPRLTELLDRGRAARLTLVSAPAGFGKTTLLARGLTVPDRQRSVAWLSLDEADGQPARFWSYLVTAVQRAMPQVGDSALALLQTAQPSLDSVLATFINELSPHPMSWTWSWTTTTSSTARTCNRASPTWSSTFHRRCTWSSALAWTRRCRWPGFALAGSWSRFVPPTCASRCPRSRST